MELNEDFSNRSKLSDVGRWFVNNFVKQVAVEVPRGSLILDAGAGECVYKKHFSHCDYKAVDLAVGEQLWNYQNLDYIAPLDKLPIDNESFDAVLCTQVLEHLERPRESVQEFHRVLKKGGKLYLTAPMAHTEHQTPYDFFRYTSFGLRSILTEAGFKQFSIEPFGGMFTRWAYELPRALSVFPSLRSPSGAISAKGIAFFPLKASSYAAIRASQSLLLMLERFDKEKNDPFGWSVIAIK